MMGDPKTFRIAAPPLARPLARSFPFSLHLSSKVPSPHACMGQRECTDLDTAADDPVAVHSEFRLREISSFGIPPKKLRAPTCGGRLELSQSVSLSVSQSVSQSGVLSFARGKTYLLHKRGNVEVGGGGGGEFECVWRNGWTARFLNSLIRKGRVRNRRNKSQSAPRKGEFYIVCEGVSSNQRPERVLQDAG